MTSAILIVGGGLSGLHTAYELTKRDIDFTLIDARDRLGGRILSHLADGGSDLDEPAGFDLGPAWFWPGQSRLTDLVRELDLADAVFTQYDVGDSLYEDLHTLHRGIPGISMAGSYRLAGGMQQLVDALAQKIDDKNIRLNTRLTQLNFTDNRLQADLSDYNILHQIEPTLAVIALPPRLALDGIQFLPGLSESRRADLNAIPTWMAAHAKVVAVYAEPFWRQRGYSGDVISLRGPLREIHDASPASGGPYALFGFVGNPAAQRRGREVAIIDAATDQFARLFGAAANQPLDVYFKDWAADPDTATEADQEMWNTHSFHRLAPIAEPEWQRKLIWSGSEIASAEERNGGFLEGAVESSQAALRLFQSHLTAGAA